MKKVILALAIGLTAMGCSRLEKGEELTNDLVGTWQLREIIDNGKWRASNHSYYFQFKSDSTFTSNKIKECPTGTYSIKDSLLSLKFDCPEIPEDLVHIMRKEETTLYLTPIYYRFCDEGCGEKFQKISNK